MITAVIWDMGGIMYRYFTDLIVEIGESRGWPIDGLACGPNGPALDAAYDDLLEGHIEEHAYLAGIVTQLADRGITFDPLAELHWPDHTRPATWAAIRQIHDTGLLQGVLTNDATTWFGDGWWDWWEPAQWFDAMVDVATVGVRKPGPEPYLAIADALGTAPEQCIFIDDMPVNCRGAEAVGMASHWFDITRPDECTESLLARLGVRA